MEASENKLESIQAVERAFKILEFVSRRGSASLNDIYNEMKVGKASLLRLCYTMVECGYLEKDARTGNYSLTLRTYEIGTGAAQNRDKMTLINNVLRELAEQTGRIAQFSIEDDNQILCLQSIGQKGSAFSAYTNVGTRSPLYCTSAGKALLASYTNSEIMEKWDSMKAKQLTEYTHKDVHSLLKDISEVRRRQYATDKEEDEYGVFCLGMVVLGASGTPLGAISITGTSLTPEEEQSLVKVLRPAVTRLSGLLGYTP
jgi:IclR family transcriptional regulator, KDG regulon repressor